MTITGHEKPAFGQNNPSPHRVRATARENARCLIIYVRVQMVWTELAIPHA